MELDGFVSLWRKSINSRVFKNEGLWKVWTWCLMKANHEEKWVSLKTGKGVVEVLVKPGQFVFGRHSASSELTMNPNTVWKRMQKLKNLQNITIESNSQYSIITIVNWDAYQVEPKKSNSKSNRQVTGKCQPSNTNNNDNNENKNKGNGVPDFISKKLWQDFREHRKKLRKPMTERAEKIIFNKLEAAKEKGYDPDKMIETAIERGWQSVFEPNQFGKQKPKASYPI